jgi:multiple sugar transport system substrate-binding protein
MLLEFLSRPKQQQRFYELTGDLPARTDAWSDSLRSSDPNRHAFWEQLQRVEPTPQVPEWEQIATKVLEYAEQAIRGNVPADTVLARLDRDVNGLLEKRRWLLARGVLASERPH